MKELVKEKLALRINTPTEKEMQIEQRKISGSKIHTRKKVTALSPFDQHVIRCIRYYLAHAEIGSCGSHT